MMRRACTVLLGSRNTEPLAQASLGDLTSDVGRSVIPAKGGLSSPRCTPLSRLDERGNLLTLRRSTAGKASSAAGPAAGSKEVLQDAARRMRGLVSGPGCWALFLFWGLPVAAQLPCGVGTSSSTSWENRINFLPPLDIQYELWYYSLLRSLSRVRSNSSSLMTTDPGR